MVGSQALERVPQFERLKRILPDLPEMNGLNGMDNFYGKLLKVSLYRLDTLDGKHDPSDLFEKIISVEQLPLCHFHQSHFPPFQDLPGQLLVRQNRQSLL